MIPVDQRCGFIYRKREVVSEIAYDPFQRAYLPFLVMTFVLQVTIVYHDVHFLL